MAQIFYPNQVLGAEFGEYEIGWQSHPSSSLGYLLGSRWRSEKDLTHFANPASGDLRTRTQALYCLDFRITDLPEVISGIELNLKTQRNGRVVDEQIQLVYQGDPLGNNNFIYITDEDGHLKITNDTTYGSATDTWGADLTPEMLQDPSFGVIVKFQAHPYYPHRSTMYLDAVSLTVY
jgi:hypothetical protein